MKYSKLLITGWHWLYSVHSKFCFTSRTLSYLLYVWPSGHMHPSLS